jgi:ABC-type sugar transport system permease subunit
VPPLALFVLFVVAPICVSLAYSLTNWNGVSANFTLIGLQNYVRISGDGEVIDAFRVTFTIAAVASIVVNLLGLPLAVLLDRQGFISRIYRSIIFYPLVLSAVVVSFIGQSMLSTDGVLNQLLGSQSGGIPFLGDPTLAVGSITLVAIWHILGFTTVMYLAGLKGIPESLYEASMLDGAGAFQRFRYITLPLLGPTIGAVTVLIVVYLMRIYEYVLVMTLGGPAGATQTVGFVLVQTAFSRNQYAYGSAIGIVLLVVVAVIAIVMLRFSRRIDYT